MPIKMAEQAVTEAFGPEIDKVLDSCRTERRIWARTELFQFAVRIVQACWNAPVAARAVVHDALKDGAGPCVEPDHPRARLTLDTGTDPTRTPPWLHEHNVSTPARPYGLSAKEAGHLAAATGVESDQLAAGFAAVEAAWSAQGYGVEAWVPVLGQRHTLPAAPIAVVTWQFGYGRVDGVWGLAIRGLDGVDQPVIGGIRRLADCPRQTRMAMTAVLPALEEALVQAAGLLGQDLIVANERLRHFLTRRGLSPAAAEGTQV